MAKNYIPNVWSAGTPITSDKMNHIEDGIKYASDTSDAFQTTYVPLIEVASSNAETAVQTANSVRNDWNTQSSKLNYAYDNVYSVITELDSTVYTGGLLQAARAYKDKISNLTNQADGHAGRLTQLEAAVVPIGNNTARISTLEGAQSTLSNYINNITSILNMVKNPETNVYESSTRLDDIEGLIADIYGDDSGNNNGFINEIRDAIGQIQSTLNHSTHGLDATYALAVAANSNLGTGFDAINTVAKAITDANTAINARATTTYVNEQLATKATSSRVEEIAGILSANSTTIIVPKNQVSFDENNKPVSLINIAIDEKNDYLIQSPEDDKYYYWKPISNTISGTYEWHLISGASGTNGDSSLTSGVVLTEEEYDELVTKNTNTDYYVLETDGYHHYRWVDNNEIEIGISDSKKYNVYIETIENDGTEVHYLNLYEFDQDEDDTITDDNFATLINKRKVHLLLPATGGSEGTITNNMRIIQITPRNTYIAYGSNIPTKLRFFFTTGEANEGASYNIMVDNISKLSQPVNITSGDPINKSYSWPTDQETGEELSSEAAAALGFYEIDVSNYCKELGTHNVKLVISLDANTSITSESNWNVQTVNLNLTSNFNINPIVEIGQSLVFSYLPGGNIEKVAHFVLDGVELPFVSLPARTNGAQTYTIPAKTNAGVYKLEVYLTANNGAIRTSSIYRDIIWKDSISSNIIISSPYRGNNETVTQYDTFNIPYTVIGNQANYDIEYYVDDNPNPVNTVKINNGANGEWNYKPTTIGDHILKIVVGEQYITINLNVIRSRVDIAPVATNLALNFNPQGLSNNSSFAKAWTDGTTHLTVSDNFDWYNGGYGSDESGDYFLVKAGTRAYLDYKMFIANQEESGTSDGSTVYTETSQVYQTGKEMKVIFKTSAVRSIDAVWFTNTGRYDAGVNKEVGIQLSVHQGWLKTDTASDVAIGTGDEQVAATNTYLYFPYSEEDKIELDININKEANKAGNYIMSYEDGVPSKAYAYTHNQKLYHVAGSESIITLGSDDCDVYIYGLRIYNSELTSDQILRNFIADGQNIDECLDRYDNNAIYYDSENNEYSPYAFDGFTLDPEALAKKIPDVKVLMLDAPSFTLGKNTFIKNSTLRCIHAPGGTVYPSRGAADNWYFENGYHAGQGTTSDKYGDAGRNIDFLFNCDGVHKPSNKVDNDPSYVSSLIIGYGTDKQQDPMYCLDWKDADTWKTNTSYSIDVLVRQNGLVYKCIENHTSNTVFDDTKWEVQENYTNKISLTANSVPNNFFNFKVNIASSENVNNALLQKRYNDFLPYISLAKIRDSRIKNDMEFVPAVLFIRESGDGEHSEFNDTNWHFYAIGNLGDSKKTDYTRAYDPTDMNEFTIEISDNNTNNSQFQTGVYWDNDIPTPEQFDIMQDMKDDGTTPIKGSYTARGTSGAIDSMNYVYPLDTPELKAMWNAVDGQGNYTNKAHWALVNEKYDGDHSFEMRYACCGDYRDGKKVNDTTGQADQQLILNSKVWQAFYSWVVTSSDEEFINELDQWCVRSAVEFWYAFTHYYTMMDSRAKNTFWHFAKTGKYRKITNPIEDMFHVYVVSEDAQLIEGTANEWTGTFTEPEGEFDASGDYYTEYAFDMWDYDNDTALGIDNNGELIFPYGKEDKDYIIEGDPSSGMVFNGAGSVFWRRLRDLCTSEISNIFTSVSEQFFSANNLIEKFDEFQGCYPETLWQLDIERKYIRPFTGESLDNSKPRSNQRFLRNMMQGRKKYQRRQWIKDQYYYFGSKYKLSNIMTDTLTLDCYTGPNANWNITLVPYQNMYLNASFGETPYRPIYAKAGQAYEMEGVFTDMNNTRIYIYGASRLQALGGAAIYEENEIVGYNGLASLYIGANDFSKAKKLRHLKLGTDDASYSNTRFNSLVLSNSPILETLDIKNCNGLAGELDLSNNNNLRVLEAEGTNYSLVTLPVSSQITTLHLPSTINNLTLSSARLLNNFYMKNRFTGEIDYSNLRNMNIDNSDYHNIPWLEIAGNNLDNLNSLYLINLNTTTIQNINELEKFKSKRDSLENESLIQLSGTIHITGDWSEVEKTTYESEWDKLTLDTTNGNKVTKYAVTYRYDDYDDGEGNIIEGSNILTLYIENGRTAPDIVSNGMIEIPTRERTVRNTFTFGQSSGEQTSYQPYTGWKLQGSSTPLMNAPTISQNTIIETYFATTVRYYPIKWYLRDNNQNILVKTSIGVKYGEGENQAAPTIEEIHAAGGQTCSVTIDGEHISYSIFNGWNKLPIKINPSINDESFDIYSTWKTGDTTITEMFNDNNITNLTPEQLLVLSAMDGTTKTTYNINSKIGINTRMTYTMGYDSNETGTVLINSPLNLNIAGSSQATSIQPLKAGNDEFTLVIDYCFNTNKEYTNRYGILASCYYYNNAANVRNGLFLYYDKEVQAPKIGFGDFTASLDHSKQIGTSSNANSRNIIVLRHPANSSFLHIYSGLDGNDNTPSTVYYTTLEYLNHSSDAYLTFGRLVRNNNEIDAGDSIVDNVEDGRGTIYWAKYWNKDLGDGECRQLAAWPHEPMTYAISYLSNNKTSVDRISTSVVPSIKLATINSTAHAKYYQTRKTNDEANNYTWRISDLYNICNSRILHGLPINLQAILCKARTSSTLSTSNVVVEQGYATYSMRETNNITYDYVQLYSAANVIPDGSIYENEDSLNSPFSWYDGTSNVLTYHYVNNSWQTNSTDENRTNYLNLRFPYVPLTWSGKLRVFVETTNRVPTSVSIIDKIRESTGSVKYGDVFVNTVGQAFIYVSTANIQNLGIQVEPIISGDNRFISDTDSNFIGRWVRADAYWTRSLVIDSNTGVNFAFVNECGIPTLSTGSAAQTGIKVNYLLSL